MTPAERELKELEELAALEAAMKGPPPSIAQGVEKLAQEKDTLKGFAKKSGKDLLRGLLMSVGTVGEGMQDLFSGGATSQQRQLNRAAGNPSFKDRVRNMLPGDPDATPAEQLFTRVAEGAGEGLSFPIPGAGLLPQMAAGSMGALGGELGGRFGARAGPLGETAGSIIGGLVGGVGTSAALGPKQSVAQSDIRSDLANLTPQQWAQAQGNADMFSRVGARTATAAEAFPGVNSSIVGRARDVASRPGGEALQAQLSQRDAELVALANRVPRAVGPAVSVPEVAGEAAKAAAARQSQLRRAASRPLDLIARDEAAGRLPQIPPNEVEGIFRDYTRLANTQGLSGSDVTARQGMLPEFLDVNAPPRQVLQVGPNRQMSFQDAPGFQQNLSSLLLNIAENSKRPTGPMATAAQTIPQRAMNEARSLAFDATRSLPAPWGPRALNAGEEYLRRKQAWVTPAQEGTLGAISGNKNRITGVVTEGKLDAVLNDVLPGATAKTLGDLRKGGADTRRIATALLQKQLESSPTNFPSVLAGSPGSPKGRQLEELVAAAGGDMNRVNDLIGTGRKLQQLSPSTIQKSPPEIRGFQYLIRPFRSLDMAITFKNEEAINREVANLLQDPANLPRLREIAQFNPNVRRAMMAKSAVLPLMYNQEEQ